MKLHTSNFIVKITYRGLLGSQGYFVTGKTMYEGGAMIRTYISLNDIVWC